MIDIKSVSGDNFNVENFKNYILELERENLKNIDKEDRKQMVSKIVRGYEEAKKRDNR